jgi:hypothetical protein
MVQAKLSQILGIKTRLISSSDGEKIYMLLKCSDNVLHSFAEGEYKAELELGDVDLSSLEPCDKLFRKYRNLLKPRYLASDIKRKESDLQPYFQIVDFSSALKVPPTVKDIAINDNTTIAQWIIYSSKNTKMLFPFFF